MEKIRVADDEDLKYKNGQKKAFHKQVMGGFVSKDKKKLYFMAIIDVLTKYSGMKNLEYFTKRALFQGPGISVCNPKDYAKRFNTFICQNIDD